MGNGKEERDAKETARLEAFSDGVFAIAITLLVLEIALIAEYVGHAQGRTAAGVYAGTYVVLPSTWPRSLSPSSP